MQDGEEVAQPMSAASSWLTVWFQLLNLAEENAGMMARRNRQDEGQPEPGLWRTVLPQLKQLLADNNAGEAEILLPCKTMRPNLC